MSFAINCFQRGSRNFEKLELVAKMMTYASPKRFKYVVEETYFDFGQGWKWTTIIREGGEWGGVQALSPRQQEDILMAETLEEMVAAVNAVFEDKWCSDRKESER